MSNKTEEFLSKIPEDNTEWVAQQILLNYKASQFADLQAQVNKLYDLLYKSWARDMSLSEIKNAVEIAADLKD